MTDLVTDAAIDALCGSVNDGDRYELEAGLNAAAKFIAAEALRQAARKLFADRAARGTGYVSREVSDYLDGIEVSAETLIALADGLEADAAFTDMVQLGQEIGEE